VANPTPSVFHKFQVESNPLQHGNVIDTSIVAHINSIYQSGSVFSFIDECTWMIGRITDDDKDVCVLP
jgi:hypothetical protein